MGLEYFQKFLHKPMQRESDFGGHLYFFENSISPLRGCWQMGIVVESGLK